MKKSVYPLLALVFLFILQWGCLVAQDQSEPGKRVNYSDPETWVLGYFDLGFITTGIHSQWYISEHDSYSADEEALSGLLAIPADDISITIVIGTWCPDSRRELPRFMKLMEFWDFPIERITFIGVDSYKVAPVGDYEELGIERVPTFIIYRNKVEAGRIIEYPTASLERDMVNILSGI
ncbi:MAG: thioredoxin family protein [Bacteroidales bacterium]